MHQAAQPPADRQLAEPPVPRERADVHDRVPEVHATPVGHVGQGASRQAAIHEQGDVEPCRMQVRRPAGEPVVALDQLEPAVALVALELDVCQATRADRLEESAAHLGHLVVPIGHVVCPDAELRGELARLALRELAEAATVGIDVRVVGLKPLVRARHDLREHHLEADGLGQGERLAELRLVLGREELA